MTDAYTCPKCKSVIKTKVLGHHTIEITCKCPHERDFRVPDNTLTNVLRDKILEFQEERKNAPAKAKSIQEKGKNSPAKEMEDVKAELSQLKKELQVHDEEEPEFSFLSTEWNWNPRTRMKKEWSQMQKKCSMLKSEKNSQGHTESGQICKIKF